MRSLAQVVAELRDEPVPEAPPVAAMSGTPAAVLARRPADGGGRPRRPGRHGGHALRRRGRGGGWSPPAALRAQGVGQDQHRRADPGAAPRPDPARSRSSSPRSTRWPARSSRPTGCSPGRRSPRPHHDASTASLVGGGSGTVRPGEISRAHCGVLLLDEFPLFRADVINALRQPLESGDISVARAEESVVLPGPLASWSWRPTRARAATSTPTRASAAATCSEVQRRDYRRKVTGPITDRIDITRHLSRRHARPPGATRWRSASRRAGAGPGRGGQGPPGRPLRRRAVAAQRPRARPGPGRPLADDDRGDQAGRRPALVRPADPPRGDPGAPARLDGRRPGRGRPAGRRGGRGRAAAAHRRPLLAVHRAEAAG